MTQQAVSASLLQAAAEMLSRRLQATPLVASQRDDTMGRVALKCESVQPTGSFKVRGALHVIEALGASARRTGVVAYSTGNHAQAVAWAAARAGLQASIVMSPDAPEDKIAKTRAHGATVLMSEPTSRARQQLAESVHAETGAALIPPFDDPRIIAGQGSIGFELARQIPDSDGVSIYVPVGGGGLIAGIASALRSLRPDIRVFGVEPVLEDDALRSLRAGRLLAADGPSASIADAIKVQRLGDLTFPIICDTVDDILLIDEEDIRQACRDIMDFEHLVAEPAAALGYAAARQRARVVPGLHVALISGGNIALSRLAALLAAPS